MIWLFTLAVSAVIYFSPGNSTASDLESACNQLSSIQVDEHKLFPEGEQTRQLSSFIGQCISSVLLNDLLATVSNYYQQQGFITTRAYLEAQDIGQGEVAVSVLIGRVGDVVMVSDGIDDQRIAGLFPEPGEVLGLSRLERAIAIIERVPSATANFSLLPGSQPGTSNIEVDIFEKDRLGLEAGVLARSDNNADLVVNVRLDNPLQQNDILWIRHNSGQVATSGVASYGNEIEYSVPLRSNLLTLSVRDYSFKQAIQGQNGSYLSTGETQTWNANWLIPLSVKGRRQWKAAGLLSSERSRSYFEDEPVDVSSYDSVEWGLSLLYESVTVTGVEFGAEYQYLAGEGDDDDDYYSGIEGFESSADSNAIRQTVSADLKLPTVESSQWLQLRFAGQVASDLLKQSRKLTLGSFNTVRGYSSALSGSEGWYLSGDYFWSWPDSSGKTMRINLGFDYGETGCEIDNQDICGDIYGAGFGWSLTDANFSAQFLAGFPLKNLSRSQADEQQLLLNLLWRL